MKLCLFFSKQVCCWHSSTCFFNLDQKSKALTCFFLDRWAKTMTKMLTTATMMIRIMMRQLSQIAYKFYHWFTVYDVSDSCNFDHVTYQISRIWHYMSNMCNSDCKSLQQQAHLVILEIVATVVLNHLVHHPFWDRKSWTVNTSLKVNTCYIVSLEKSLCWKSEECNCIIAKIHFTLQYWIFTCACLWLAFSKCFKLPAWFNSFLW